MAEPAKDPAARMQSRIEEALRATERKWALIALTGKVPVHKGWQNKKAPALAEVERWLRKGHNLGLRTGLVSGVIVIDDDSPDGSACADLNLPKTVTVITGSGKQHHYFKAPDFKIGNSVKTLADGIDVRGDGGQVVFVGSIHPETKQPYRWAPGLSPAEVDLATLPDAIITKLRKAKPSSSKVEFVKGDGTASGEDQRVRTYANAALAAEVRRVQQSTEGNRNDTLNRAAFALGQIVGAGALDREQVRLALKAAAAVCGLTEAEIDQTIDSGIVAGMKEPRDIAAAMQAHAESEADDQGEADDNRPPISIYPGCLPTAVSKAERVLLRQQPPLIYQRGTTLVRIVWLPEAGAGRTIRTRPVIQEVTNNFLIDKLTDLIAWRKVERRTGDLYPVDCPERVALTLLSRSGAWNVPPLIGVIDCPTLRSDGEVLDTEGYDKESGLYVALGGRKWPAVPDQPTQEDAHAALRQLLWVLRDFPFLGRADRAVALAALLTALIRPSLHTAPLFAFRAAKMGSGKSLLADVVAMIATGRPAAVMSQGADENEDKKRMLPILAEGDTVAVIDNIERPFGSAALCSILTQTIWRDRVLGASRTMTLPTTNTTWIATGNNIVFVGDITTRVVACDLDPKCEHPEARKFEVNLYDYIPKHREELVVAALTILRAYHVAGRPDLNLPVFGRFEEWSNWIRSALVWLGEADPCDTRRRVEETDPVRAELTSLLAALHAHFNDKAFQVSAVLSDMKEHDTLREAASPILATAAPGQSPAQCLGLFFQRVHRRPEGGLRLMRGPNRGGSACWRIERV